MHSQGSVALTVTLQSHSIFLGYFLFYFWVFETIQSMEFSRPEYWSG